MKWLFLSFKIWCWSFLFFVIFNSFNWASAQSCLGFYKTARCAIKHSSDFKQYGQARSAALEVGKKYKCEVLLYGSKDYIFNICSDYGFKYIHYRIVDKLNNELIYDNAEDNYNSGIAFSVEKITNVEIEVEVLYDKDKNEDPEKYRVCIGIQIVWRKIPKLGFKK